MYSDKTIIRDSRSNLFMRVLMKIRWICTKQLRKKLNEHIAEQLADINFTVLSNNCIGGVIYHDAGRRFTSPTINLAFDAEDFIKFLANPLKYKDADFEFYCVPGCDFPIARIENIEVHFVHYHSEEECVTKWRERFERIAWDNIFIVATDNDGMNKDCWKKRFDQLPYPNKIMFVANSTPKYSWEIPVKQFRHRNSVRILTTIANFKGQRYYETAFDIPAWISARSMRE